MVVLVMIVDVVGVIVAVPVAVVTAAVVATAVAAAVAAFVVGAAPQVDAFVFSFAPFLCFLRSQSPAHKLSTRIVAISAFPQTSGYLGLILPLRLFSSTNNQTIGTPVFYYDQNYSQAQPGFTLATACRINATSGPPLFFENCCELDWKSSSQFPIERTTTIKR